MASMSEAKHLQHKAHNSSTTRPLVDGNKRFLSVDVGQYGRVTDGNVFMNSSMGKRLTRQTFGLPPDEDLGGHLLPYVIVADEAFPLKRFLMRPYPRSARRLSESERIFNYRLSRSRNTVENAFGILASVWRIYQTPLECRIDLAEKIILATVVLHNYIHETPTQGKPGVVNEEAQDNSLVPLHVAAATNATRDAIQIRNFLTNYFTSTEGQWACFPRTDGDKNSIKDSFMEATHFPGVIGAVDCTHVEIVQPPIEDHNYINRKGYHSKNIQIICDYDLKILNINARFPGATHDAFIWRNSCVREELETCYTRGDRISWLLGDSGYPQEPWPMTPILNLVAKSPESHLRRKMLSRARRYIECTFGIMSNKWRILHRPMDVDINFAVDIIKCLCILHNFVRKRDGYRFEDTLTVVGLEDAGNGDNININRSLNRYRDALANYFVTLLLITLVIQLGNSISPFPQLRESKINSVPSGRDVLISLTIIDFGGTSIV
nr:unnamed protein product [Callosobruchus analis]